jgi:hypothetical protein
MGAQPDKGEVSRVDGESGLRRGLPDVDRGVCVALPAKDHGVAVAAAVSPDVEDPTFFAEGFFASVADNHRLVYPADFAHPASDRLNHDGYRKNALKSI